MWHSLTTQAVIEKLASSTKGLSDQEFRTRLQQFGKNEIQEDSKSNAWKIFLNQFKNLLTVMLLLAGLVSAIIGHQTEAISIFLIVLFAIVLGFFQEFKAEHARNALKKMSAPKAKVLRNQEPKTIPAWQVVPGDIILLTAGDRVPADARLLESVNLKADESALTGESLPSEKNAGMVLDKSTLVADRLNMTFAGTSINKGRATAIAVETGMKTEFGKIAGMLKNLQEEQTPLQKSLDKMGKVLVYFSLIVIAFVVLIGVFRGQNFLDMLIFGIAFAVAVVPEALPAVVTISLALGMQKMVQKNALLRRLTAVETLGCTTVICTDKTGTLTMNEMTVQKIYAAGTRISVSGSGYQSQGNFSVLPEQTIPQKTLHELLLAGLLCNDSSLNHENKAKRKTFSITGDPTEAALLVAADKNKLDRSKLTKQFVRFYELPFTHESRQMTTFHRHKNTVYSFAKGALEVILDRCSWLRTEKGREKLTPSKKAELLRENENLARQGLRVIAIASQKMTNLKTSAKDISKLESSLRKPSHEDTFLGLAGMMDSPRPESKAAIKRCLDAGIRPVMITGDHPITAEAIARDLGILSDGGVITGAELETADEAFWESKIHTAQVFARVSPEHKLRIVTALQKKGHVVAMTGDGVNDAPALKKADIGISMGLQGTDVAKESSSMILTDDNFSSIVAAVEQGRIIFDNIKKYLVYLLSSNIGEMTLIAAAALLGYPLPLTAVQLLFINLATDGLPAIALAVDPGAKNIMHQKPRDPGIRILSGPVLFLTLTGGLCSAAVNLFLFIFWQTPGGHSVNGPADQLFQARALVFISLIFIEFAKAYLFKSFENPLYQSFFKNKWLNLSIAAEILLVFLILYLPFFQKSMGTFALGLNEWPYIAATVTTVILVLELAKFFLRRIKRQNKENLA